MQRCPRVSIIDQMPPLDDRAQTMKVKVVYGLVRQVGVQGRSYVKLERATNAVRH